MLIRHDTPLQVHRALDRLAESPEWMVVSGWLSTEQETYTAALIACHDEVVTRQLQGKLALLREFLGAVRGARAHLIKLGPRG